MIDIDPPKFRVSAYGYETRVWREATEEKRDITKSLLLAVLWQAGMDYHEAKRSLKRRNIKTESDFSRLPKWEKEKVIRGKEAWEWFTQPEDERCKGLTFQYICKIFGVKPSRMWGKIKKTTDLSKQLGDLSTTEQNGPRKHAKLTNECVKEIRKLYSEGMRQDEIAERMCVKQNTISRVVRGETWKHVQ